MTSMFTRQFSASAAAVSRNSAERKLQMPVASRGWWLTFAPENTHMGAVESPGYGVEPSGLVGG